VTGAGVASLTWDTGWRAGLVDNLEIMVRQLWEVEVDRIFIDGSFVEEKGHPNDIDGYFECELLKFASGELRELPMWHQYRVELYPHFPGLLSGLRDQFGNELEFMAGDRDSE
jgi:hypothetical protein